MTRQELTKRVISIDERLTKIESTQPYLEKLLEQNIESINKLAHTMDTVQVTMAQMNTELLSVTSKVDGLISKVDNVKENQTLNIMSFIKKYFPWIVVAIGGLVYKLGEYFNF